MEYLHRNTTLSRAVVRILAAIAVVAVIQTTTLLNVDLLIPKSTYSYQEMPHFKNQNCQIGTYESPQQWRELFRRHISFEKKALVAIPIGRKARESLDVLIDSMGHNAFDYMLFPYDDFPWETENWADKQGVTLLPNLGGRKWNLYYDKLKNRTHIERYSHLFLWDDDLRPVPDLFDGEVLLHILQQLKIEIAQPMIRENHHGEQYEGTDFKTLGGGDRDGALLREVQVVEIMAPCYSVRVWLDCILPRMIVGGGEGGGWGIDLVLHNTGSCVPEKLFSIAIPLDHVNGKALKKNFQASMQEVRAYDEMARLNHWQTRHSLIACQFNHSFVRVDSDCSVRTVFENSTRFVKESSTLVPCKRQNMMG